MGNYKQRLTEQKAALEKDVKEYNDEIFTREELLDDLKKKRDAVNKELRYLTKKLEKLTGE